MYGYVRAGQSASSTSPSQFVAAFRLSHGLLGMVKTLISEGLSQSVVGAAHSSFVSKHVQRPAQVLMLDEISAFLRMRIMSRSFLSISLSVSWQGHVGMTASQTLTFRPTRYEPGCNNGQNQAPGNMSAREGCVNHLNGPKAAKSLRFNPDELTIGPWPWPSCHSAIQVGDGLPS